ncbi:MAG: TOMM precursor leader peptide-binding protein [Leptolyngbya sp. SIO1E4]|nr:TOMM precursor leader peptide-binding protein [Leptolyngbya sp. SIO1E4]
MKKPQIKPHFRLEIIEPKHVYLLSEYSTQALTGGLYCQILPLLNGQHTREALIQKLDGQVPPEHLDYVLDRLQDKGYLTDAAHELTPEMAAFWSGLGVEPQQVAEHLSQSQVTVTAIGATNPQPLLNSLQAIGISVQQRQPEELIGEADGENSLLVVLTDDYLQPELRQINQKALNAQQPWLLGKPMGNVLWLGPIFHPGQTGCWACLAQRLWGNHEVESSVLRQKGQLGQLGNASDHQACLPVAFAGFPAMVQTAIGLTTTEIAKWLVKRSIPDSSIQTLAGTLITLDQATLTLKTHQLPHRPQCPTCGDADLVHQQVNQPLALTSRKKLFTQDGGHRAFTPEQIVSRHEHLISPITGVVSSLVRSSDPDNSFVHTYSAVHAFGSATSLNQLRRSLRHKSGGKGKTDRQSKASGFCEAIERYSGIYQGDEPKVSATFKELGEQAIHPYQCLLFSERQYQNREQLNQAIMVDHDWIAQPFDETQTIDWTPVWSLTEKRHKYLPTAFCYYNYKLPKTHRFCSADSNGNAAGGTLEDAILQGFLELAERDSVALWWYNRLPRPGIDLASFNDPYLLDLQTWYQTQQRELWVLDLTTDLNIPAFAAVSRYTGSQQEYIVAGYGAHFDPKIAVSRAVTEVNQMGGHLPEKHPPTEADSALSYWFTQATIANQPYLAPDPQLPVKQYTDYPQQWSDDIYQDVLQCAAVVKQAGLEMLVLNQTRPDIGLPVVKVMVPGLRHFWSRFGAGRLYDVPVKLGWQSAPLAEEQMNSMPMVF